jgi:hypothetical protein
MSRDGYVPRLKQRYRAEVISRLQGELGYANVMQVPTIEKIVVNMGVGDAIKDGRMLEAPSGIWRRSPGRSRSSRRLASQSPASSSARGWRSGRR